MKGVAMSAGRRWREEIYVGFLLFLLSFLYLSHLTSEFRSVDFKTPVNANVEKVPYNSPKTESPLRTQA